MKLLFASALAIVGAVYAQSNPNSTVGVGGSDPPITSPQVMGFNSLDGRYKHVIILSIDGFHAVNTHYLFG